MDQRAMNSNCSITARAGFSLAELLIVLTILGLLLYLAFPNIVQVKSDSELQLAKARAEALNMAAAAYVQSQGLEGWSSLSEEERYLAIKPFIAFPADDLASFLPSSDFGVSFNPTSPHKMKAVLRALTDTNVAY
jgi:prepilin-type N-terminal cleavage/methylation domain-containing protein